MKLLQCFADQKAHVIYPTGMGMKFNVNKIQMKICEILYFYGDKSFKSTFLRADL